MIKCTWCGRTNMVCAPYMFFHAMYILSFELVKYK